MMPHFELAASMWISELAASMWMNGLAASSLFC
jgi:hypothetical protein